MADLWWRNAVVYQVYPRSFADSDASGEGDLPGLRTGLPYLASLGVDAIWLNPFYPSPMHDSGYDIANYCDVDPRFGTLADFDDLVKDAGVEGIRVIIDIVPTSSSQHPWFRRALDDGPGSSARERFIFRDVPNNWQSIFGGPAWTKTPDGQWYLHLFDATQPDFNWRHPDVPAMFEQVLRFWLDRGVAGVRIDMANTLFKDPELPDRDMASAVVPYYDQPETRELYRSWRKILDSYPVNFPRSTRSHRGNLVPKPADRPAVPDEGRAATVVQLPVNACAMDGGRVARGDRRSARAGRGVRRFPAVGAGNHDITRVVTRLGIDQALIRHPTDALRRGAVQPDLPLGTRRARAAALLLLALPGAAYLYQGDELGLPEYLDIPADLRQDPTFHRTSGAAIGRDGCRIPMPWSGDIPPYSFADRQVRTWLPQPSDWAPLTVAAESANTDSMLQLYRAALRLRREHPALGDGEMSWLETADVELVFARDPGFGFHANLGDAPVSLPTGMPCDPGQRTAQRYTATPRHRRLA